MHCDIFLKNNRSQKNVQKSSEELQAEMEKLLTKLTSSEKENKELHKQLRKYEKGTKGSATPTPRSKLTQSGIFSANISDEDDDDAKSKKSQRNIRVGDKQVRIVSEEAIQLEDLHRRKNARMQEAKNEERITQIKIECVRKSNELLKQLNHGPDYKGEIWANFEEMEVIKRGEKILCCKLQTIVEHQRNQAKQYLVLKECSIWDEMISERQKQTQNQTKEELQQSFGQENNFYFQKKQFDIGNELLECFVASKEELKALYHQ